MRALVVYESMFGNTQAIAKAVATGLGSRMIVGIIEVSDAPATLDGIDLIVAGGPTHALSMSRPQTRNGAAEQATTDLVSKGIGLREWVAQLGTFAGTVAATFDTRFPKPRWMTGSAARSAAKHLRRSGCRVLAAESFFVTGTKGPLADAEEERARLWGETLAAKVTSAGLEHPASVRPAHG